MNIHYISNNQLPTIKAHGIQIIKTCEALKELGVDVELIIPDRGIYPQITETDPLEYYQVKHRFPVKKLPSYSFGTRGSRLLFWLQQYLFARTVRRYLKHPALVYSRDPFIIRTLSRQGHELYWEAHQFPRNIRSGFYRTVLDHIRGLVVISDGLKKAFVKSGFPEQRIITAPDGFDPVEFVIPETKAEMRQKLRVPHDRKIVLYAGQLFEWKGVDILVQAAQYLHDGILVLVVGGTTEDLARIKKLDQCGRVRFEGFKPRKEIPGYLRAADIAILPNKKDRGMSEFYTSPLKLFEYMAAGLPIVASDLPSIREILNETNSVLVEPDHARALATAITRLADDPVKMLQLGRCALRDSAQYSWIARARKIKTHLCS